MCVCVFSLTLLKALSFWAAGGGGLLAAEKAVREKNATPDCCSTVISAIGWLKSWRNTTAGYNSTEPHYYCFPPLTDAWSLENKGEKKRRIALQRCKSEINCRDPPKSRRRTGAQPHNPRNHVIHEIQKGQGDHSGIWDPSERCGVNLMPVSALCGSSVRRFCSLYEPVLIGSSPAPLSSFICIFKIEKIQSNILYIANLIAQIDFSLKITSKPWQSSKWQEQQTIVFSPVCKGFCH